MATVIDVRLDIIDLSWGFLGRLPLLPRGLGLLIGQPRYRARPHLAHRVFGLLPVLIIELHGLESIDVEIIHELLICEIHKLHLAQAPWYIANPCFAP
jgi:hypothetical protein